MRNARMGLPASKETLRCVQNNGISFQCVSPGIDESRRKTSVTYSPPVYLSWGLGGLNVPEISS
jgi:hypothetical protein